MFSYTEGVSSDRLLPTRPRISGSGQPYGLTYPSPFFDIAQTYLPDTIRSLFRWCRYYYLTNPIIFTVINKMAEYPITDIIIESGDKCVDDKWRSLFEDTLNIRSFLIDFGLYYQCFGNAEVSIFFPFIKFLTCNTCNYRVPIKETTYRYHGFRFFLNPCPKCGSTGEASAKDIAVKSPEQIRLNLWNPEDILVAHNDVTGENQYYFDIPRSSRNDIMMGKPHIIETMPQLILDAVREQKQVRISPGAIFHSRRPSLLSGTKDAGLGIPILLPVLKDNFSLQILKKANESIALERIYPLSVVFPQQSSATVDPLSTINLGKWREHVQQEIGRWRLDRGYIPIMPLPLGHQVIGGEGRGLLMFQEVQMLIDQCIAGMGVPREFILGGLSWSGSNVSLRMLENQFLRYISDLSIMITKFLIKNIAAYLDWPIPKVRFKPFKMADDIQQKGLFFQYSQANKISDETLLSNSDLDAEKEDQIMRKELRRRMESIRQLQLAQAEIQGEVQVIMAKYQARAQSVAMREQQQAQAGMEDSAPGEARESMPAYPMMGSAEMGQMTPAQPEVAPAQVPISQEIAQQMAQQLVPMPEPYRKMAVEQIAAQNPQLAAMVVQFLSMMGSSAQSNTANTSLPEQLPPRRGPESALI